MDLANNPLDYEDNAKRFKTSEEYDEFEQDSANDILPPQMQGQVELDDTNSFRLKKGNLVVRKFKDGYQDLHRLQAIEGFQMIVPEQRQYKSVKYHPDHALEAVKFFKKDAEPSAPALTIDQVQQIWHDIENNKNEDSKYDSGYSSEQQQRDGFNKDKKRVLDNIKKVSEFHHNTT